MKDLEAKVVLAVKVDEDGKKKISCGKAFAIASEFNVTPAEIGKVCIDNGIKICNCQLGCF